jgi:hypothetical protein
VNALNRSALAALLAVLGSAELAGQKLHVNHRWDDCAFVIDPSLTQDAWRQFVGEVGLVTFFRPLASAEPLGAGNVEFALLQWSTRIDDADPAWNDTFSHPDSTHWLFDGDALPLPGLMLRAGVTERVDVGAYFTKNLNSNYGIVGGQVQYGLLDGGDRDFSAAGRASVSHLFGPEDLSATVYGLELVVSRELSVVTPYAAVAGYLSSGREHTSKVNLADEHVFGVRGTLGVAARISVLRLGAEVNLGEVTGYAIKVGFGS